MFELPISVHFQATHWIKNVIGKKDNDMTFGKTKSAMIFELTCNKFLVGDIGKDGIKSCKS